MYVCIQGTEGGGHLAERAGDIKRGGGGSLVGYVMYPEGVCMGVCVYGCVCLCDPPSGACRGQGPGHTPRRLRLYLHHPCTQTSPVPCTQTSPVPGAARALGSRRAGVLGVW